jgi:N-acetylmuramoyl-L-alanine amidase
MTLKNNANNTSFAKKRIFSVFLVSVALIFASFTIWSADEQPIEIQSDPLYAYKEIGVKTIVIDPGHGGKDPGCGGKFSSEKDVALDISLIFGKYIEDTYDDVKVIYTRKTDKFVDLAERAKIANRENADLFVCIHVNAGPSTAKGNETYVMGLHKTKSNLLVAQRENSSILMEENHETTYSNFDPSDPDSYIGITLRQSAFLEQSISFADKIQKQFKKNVKIIPDRGIKQAGFLVLHRTAMPAVLVETGFLTNPAEEKTLNDSLYQIKIGKSIFNAFVSYKNEVEGVNKAMTGHEEGKDVLVVNPNEGSGDTTDETENRSRILFKVQLSSSSEPVPLKPSNFKGIHNVDEYISTGTYKYKYTVGNKSDYEEALKLQRFVREKGFSSAFIVAFKDGIRTDVQKARQELADANK